MNIAEVFELTPTDYFMIVLVLVLAYRWFRRRNEPDMPPPPKQLPPLPKQDMTLAELRKYDGEQEERILFALNGTIYDVTRGKNFYGPGGPYGNLAGRDATRSLGTMDAKAVKDEWDDHEDMKPDEREQADEWESSFKYKYATVGRLVKTEGEKKDYEGALSAIADFPSPPKPKAN